VVVVGGAGGRRGGFLGVFLDDLLDLFHLLEFCEELGVLHHEKGQDGSICLTVK
jgi:hypothetical protein